MAHRLFLLATSLVLILVFLLVAVDVASGFVLFPNHQNGFQQPKHAPGVEVADYARHDLPPVRMGERTIDLMSGIHFVSPAIRLNSSRDFFLLYLTTD